MDTTALSVWSLRWVITSYQVNGYKWVKKKKKKYGKSKKARADSLYHWPGGGREQEVVENGRAELLGAELVRQKGQVAGKEMKENVSEGHVIVRLHCMSTNTCRLNVRPLEGTTEGV